MPTTTYLRFTPEDMSELLDILAWAERDQDEMRQLATNDDEAEQAQINLQAIERMRHHVSPVGSE